MRSLSILFVIALCVHASVCGASPRFPWAGRRGMVGFVGGSKSHSQGEGLDLSKKTSSSEISALRGGEGRCLVPSGISGKIFAIDSLVALTWSWFGAFGDGESWSNYVVDAPEGIADVPSFIEGSKHIGGYYACCALNIVYRNMMLSAEPEDSENLKRVHFGNALMFAGIVLQNYRTRNFIRNPYPFMIMHGILGIVHIIRGVQLHNK